MGDDHGRDYCRMSEDIMADSGLLAERFDLAYGRLGQLCGSEAPETYSMSGVPTGIIQKQKAWLDFFSCQASFLLFLKDVYDHICAVPEDDTYLAEINKKLYEDVVPGNYHSSYSDPGHAAGIFGEKNGAAVSLIAAEMRAAIPSVFENDPEGLLIRMELLLMINTSVNDYYTESDAEDEETLLKHIKEDIYVYVSDYYETECEKKICTLTEAKNCFAASIIKEYASDPEDIKKLYRYGEYITENEIKTAEYIASLSEEEISSIAGTLTEGYRRGFEISGRDLSIKKTADIRYPIGFERIIAKAIDNLKDMGLDAVIHRSGQSLFNGYSVSKNGFFGANPNPQFDFDHREDLAFILDGQLVTRRLECLKAAWEKHKDSAKVHAGPVVLECFGSKPFVPESCVNALKYSEKQRSLNVRFRTESGTLTNHFIPGEERSFTIMALPVYDSGKDFEKIFDAVLKINTLDNELYFSIQQNIIDVLDKADHICVRGMNGNCTDLNIALVELTDPEHQTKFENCVADVNIPVGEVFTSPVLNGTNGTLHVSRVFLNEIEYRNLRIELTDGMVSDYSCANFEDPAECRHFIEENILFNHKTLPVGEAAIGTNTTAYVLSKKYGFESLLPILIAEKTGPHFALGDTCYSHSEDIKVYNPDGKEIIARDNEISILRKEDISKAYFNCHTDITIPYDELGSLTAVASDGSETAIIKDGRFVLKGTEELNKAFEL